MLISRHEMDELTPEQVETWNVLLRDHAPVKSAFLSYDFARAVHDARGGVVILNIRLGDGSAGFLPLQMRIGMLGHAEKIASDMSDYFGIVGDIRTVLDQDQLLSGAGLSALRFDHGVGAMCNFTFANKEVAQGVYVPVPDLQRYAAMLAATDKEFVKRVARSARQFSREIGPLRFDWHTQYAGAGLDWLIATKSAQYRRTNVSNTLAAPWRKLFLRRLLEEPQSSRCRVVLSTLTTDGRWVAASLNLLHGSTMHVWYPVYDTRFRKYSPGNFLFLKMFEQATGYGVDLFDFGKGAAKYKMKYMGELYELWSGVARRSTPFGLLDRLIQSTEWRLTDARKSLQTGQAQRSEPEMGD